MSLDAARYVVVDGEGVPVQSGPLAKLSGCFVPKDGFRLEIEVGDFAPRPIDALDPDRKTLMMIGDCATCGERRGSYRDGLSAREGAISGMCQACQDGVFGGAEGERMSERYWTVHVEGWEVADLTETPGIVGVVDEERGGIFAYALTEQDADRIAEALEYTERKENE